MPILLAAFIIPLALYSGSAYALGLADLKIQSYINEKLNAQLQLVGELEGDGKNIKLDFELVDASDDYEIKYQINKKSIKLYTSRPFMEDVLNLQITVMDGDNKITKKYKKVLEIDPKLLKLAQKQTVVEVQAPQAGMTKDAKDNKDDDFGFNANTDGKQSTQPSIFIANSPNTPSASTAKKNNSDKHTPSIKKEFKNIPKPEATPENSDDEKIDDLAGELKLIEIEKMREKTAKAEPTKRNSDSANNTNTETTPPKPLAYKTQANTMTDYLDIKSSVNFSGLLLQKNAGQIYEQEHANLLKLQQQKQNLLNQLNLTQSKPANASTVNDDNFFANTTEIKTWQKTDTASVLGSVNNQSADGLGASVQGRLITPPIKIGFWQTAGQRLDLFFAKYLQKNILKNVVLSLFVLLLLIGVIVIGMRYRARQKRIAIKKRLDAMVKELNELKTLSEINHQWLRNFSDQKNDA